MQPSIRRQSPARRSGKILVLLAILLPVFCGIAGLIIDQGLLMLESRHVQNVADMAATAAATELRLGNSAATAIAAAENEISTNNNLPDATVAVHVPPTTGPYAGSSNYAEVTVQKSVDTHFIHVLNGRRTEMVMARAVAGIENATVGAAIVVLDPDPEPVSVAPIPLTVPLSFPALIGGLEVLGVGNTQVQSAVLVNTQWGGVDQDGNPAGESAGPPYGISCTPILSTTKLYTTDLRVAGGVDSPTNYPNLQTGQPSPLRANRLPVLDPLRSLPAPTLSADAANVKSTTNGGRTILTLPIITTTLNPGVYDYINVIAGRVVFNPGVYIIRGTNPNTPPLNLVAGQIVANGVMFYLTNTTNYSPATGLPDTNDGETQPAAFGSGSATPSATVNLGLTGSSFTPLNSPSSPFHGMMFYQRRQDRRPLVLIQENLISGGGALQGIVYAKWGHIILAGTGTYNARFVAGTMRCIALLNMNINPTSLFPPAQDVFLVE